MKRQPKETMYYTYRQENPKGKLTGDCVIRAIASALQKDWDTVYDDLYNIGKKYKLMPNDSKCYERYLRANGYERQKQPRDAFNKKLTGKEFCDLLNDEYSRGLRDRSSIVLRIGSHHLTMIEWGSISGFTICDSWDCSYERVGKWYSKEGAI